MAEKKFFVDINLQGSNVTNLKADTLDITTNSAASNTKRIVYHNGQYYYSNGTSWILLSSNGSLPTGGAAGQILAKASSTDYDAEWINNYLKDLADVSITGRTNNTILGYNSSTNLNEFKTISDWLDYTPANKAGETFTGAITATNLSGTNTGDETNTSIKYKLGSATSSNDGYLTSTDWSTFNNKVSSSLLGASNGVATLDSGGKVPSSQLPSSVMNYHGTYDIVTNTPALSDGMVGADPGDVYICSTAGTRNFGSGDITVGLGDWLIYSQASIWEKSDNSDAVVSVNGYTGVVSLGVSDISGAIGGSGTTNYFTKFTGTNTIGVNSLLYDTGSRIGLGITTPDALFHINNISTADSFRVDDESNSDTTPFIIAANGNTSIGTTTGNYKFSVQDSDPTNGIIQVVSNNNGGNATTGSKILYDVSGVGNFWTGMPATRNAWSVGLYDNSTNPEYLTVTDTGNVGIGTITPISATNYISLNIGDNDASKTGLLKFSSTYNNGNGAEIYQSASGTTLFNVNSSLNGFIIDSEGNMGVGNSISGLSPLSAKLHVNNIGTGNSFLVEDSNNPDASPFVIDKDGNVGIGTETLTSALSSDARVLAIRDTAPSNNVGSIRAYGGGTLTSIELFGAPSLVGLYGSTNTPMTFSTNSTERIRITADGNVGIGTTGPFAKLTVDGTISLLSTLNSTNGSVYIDHPGVTVWNMGITSTNTSTFHIGNGAAFANKILNITNDGNVGIGTVAPSTKLDLNGSMSIASGLSNTSPRPAVGTSVLANGEIHSYSTVLGPTGDDGFLRLSAGGGSTLYNKTYIDIAGYSADNELNHSIVFGIRSSERMRVDVNGNLGIGTNSPTARLHVAHTDNYDAFRIDDDNNPDVTPFVIDRYGNVGIGTSTPSTKLEVDGDLKVSTIANATTNTGKILVSDNGVVKYRTAAETISDILTVTNTGTSGAATLTGTTLNIPVYEESLIPKLQGNEIWRGATFRNNVTTVDTTGGITLSASGTATAKAVASTSYATRSIRLNYNSAVSVQTGRYTGIRGSALLWYVTGGFLYTGEFNISDTSTAVGTHNFWGLASSTSDLVIGGVSNDQPSALTNIIAFANDSGDSNLQIMHNDASGVATKTDLGSSFPSNRTAGAAITTIYSCYLYNAPNSSDVIYRIVNKETGVVAQGTLSTNLPASTVGLNFFGARTMGTSGGGVTQAGQFDVYKLGVYSL